MAKIYLNINTTLSFLVTITLTEKTTKDIIFHGLCYIPIVGAPNQTITDNGTSYYSQAFEIFVDKLI